MTYRHADPCDCGDPQHCGAFGCPCMTVAPDPESPCGWLMHPEYRCAVSGVAHVLLTARPHDYRPTLCRCRHSIEVTR